MNEAYETEIDTIQSLFFDELLDHEKLPYWPYCYARDVLHGRFEAGEEVIAKDGQYSLYYGRFEKGEKAIAKNYFADMNKEFLNTL